MVYKNSNYSNWFCPFHFIKLRMPVSLSTLMLKNNKKRPLITLPSVHAEICKIIICPEKSGLGIVGCNTRIIQE